MLQNDKKRPAGCDMTRHGNAYRLAKTPGTPMSTLSELEDYDRGKAACCLALKLTRDYTVTNRNAPHTR
jgi:hypothetical protein